MPLVPCYDTSHDKSRLQCVCVFHPKTPFSHLFLKDDLVKLHFSIPNEMELILFPFHSKFLHLKRVHKLEITGMSVEIWF